MRWFGFLPHAMNLHTCFLVKKAHANQGSLMQMRSACRRRGLQNEASRLCWQERTLRSHILWKRRFWQTLTQFSSLAHTSPNPNARMWNNNPGLTVIFYVLSLIDSALLHSKPLWRNWHGNKVVLISPLSKQSPSSFASNLSSLFFLCYGPHC